MKNSSKSKPMESVPTVFIGIDNGPSGSIGIMEYTSSGMRKSVTFMKTPTYMMQDYTKAKKRISQVDLRLLRKAWKRFKEYNVYIAMERPFTFNGRFNAVVVAMRVHQQYLDLFKMIGFPEPVIIDSGQWQKKFLPKGTKGDELKKRSKEIANRLWPKACASVRHPDCDGIFICEWMRKEIMGQ